MPDGAAPVLDVKGLKTVFRTRGGEIHAVNSVSFHLQPGELLGVVGESGSGKSVTMMSLLGLLPSPPADVRGGQVLLAGQDLLKISADDLQAVRGARVGFIFQDPMTSLNPVFTVGNQICEPLIKHLGMSKSQAETRAVELLDTVGIPDARKRLRDYPHQFSGGMRQRVMIAIALACNPDVLIADEPTTALDVTIQAQIVDLVRDLKARSDMSVVWITHDFALIAGLADRIAVLYAGTVVEDAPVQTLFDRPTHPYTRGLLASLPTLSDAPMSRLASIAGTPPEPGRRPPGCPFAPRCTLAEPPCTQTVPHLTPVPGSDPRHRVACPVTTRNVKTGGTP